MASCQCRLFARTSNASELIWTPHHNTVHSIFSLVAYFCDAV